MRSLRRFYCFIYESTFYSHFTQLVWGFCGMDHVSSHSRKLAQFPGGFLAQDSDIQILLGTGIGQIRYLNRALMRFDGKVCSLDCFPIRAQIVWYRLWSLFNSCYSLSRQSRVVPSCMVILEKQDSTRPSPFCTDAQRHSLAFSFLPMVPLTTEKSMCLTSSGQTERSKMEQDLTWGRSGKNATQHLRLLHWGNKGVVLE